MQNELIRKDEIIKILIETETSILDAVSKPSVKEEDRAVALIRNRRKEEMQSQKSLCKKNDKEPKNIYIGNLSLNTKIDDLYELLGLRSTKCLGQKYKINMQVNEKSSKCWGFVICVSTEHLQKEILKLNSITLENRINVIENQIYAKMRDTQNLQKYPKFPFVVINNTQKIRLY